MVHQHSLVSSFVSTVLHETQLKALERSLHTAEHHGRLEVGDVHCRSQALPAAGVALDVLQAHTRNALPPARRHCMRQHQRLAASRLPGPALGKQYIGKAAPCTQAA
jgi:hypothetical protein